MGGSPPPVPSDLEPESAASYARAALVDWFTARAREHLPSSVATWAMRAGVDLPTVVVTSQEKRWGSCSNGVLRLNWRIIQTPRRLIDYVVAHEVTHLRHADHGPAFWSALGRVLPAYESRRDRRRQLGPELVW